MKEYNISEKNLKYLKETIHPNLRDNNSSFITFKKIGNNEVNFTTKKYIGNIKNCSIGNKLNNDNVRFVKKNNSLNENLDRIKTMVQKLSVNKKNNLLNFYIFLQENDFYKKILETDFLSTQQKSMFVSNSPRKNENNIIKNFLSQEFIINYSENESNLKGDDLKNFFIFENSEDEKKFLSNLDEHLKSYNSSKEPFSIDSFYNSSFNLLKFFLNYIENLSISSINFLFYEPILLPLQIISLIHFFKLLTEVWKTLISYENSYFPKELFLKKPKIDDISHIINFQECENFILTNLAEILPIDKVRKPVEYFTKLFFENFEEQIYTENHNMKHINFFLIILFTVLTFFGKKYIENKKNLLEISTIDTAVLEQWYNLLYFFEYLMNLFKNKNKMYVTYVESILKSFITKILSIQKISGFYLKNKYTFFLNSSIFIFDHLRKNKSSHSEIIPYSKNDILKIYSFLIEFVFNGNLLSSIFSFNKETIPIVVSNINSSLSELFSYSCKIFQLASTFKYGIMFISENPSNSGIQSVYIYTYEKPKLNTSIPVWVGNKIINVIPNKNIMNDISFNDKIQYVCPIGYILEYHPNVEDFLISVEEKSYKKINQNLDSFSYNPFEKIKLKIETKEITFICPPLQKFNIYNFSYLYFSSNNNNSNNDKLVTINPKDYEPSLQKQFLLSCFTTLFTVSCLYIPIHYGIDINSVKNFITPYLQQFPQLLSSSRDYVSSIVSSSSDYISSIVSSSGDYVSSIVLPSITFYFTWLMENPFYIYLFFMNLILGISCINFFSFKKSRSLEQIWKIPKFIIYKGPIFVKDCISFIIEAHKRHLSLLKNITNIFITGTPALKNKIEKFIGIRYLIKSIDVVLDLFNNQLTLMDYITSNFKYYLPSFNMGTNFYKFLRFIFNIFSDPLLSLLSSFWKLIKFGFLYIFPNKTNVTSLRGSIVNNITSDGNFTSSSLFLQLENLKLLTPGTKLLFAIIYFTLNVLYFYLFFENLLGLTRGTQNIIQNFISGNDNTRSLIEKIMEWIRSWRTRKTTAPVIGGGPDDHRGGGDGGSTEMLSAKEVRDREREEDRNIIISQVEKLLLHNKTGNTNLQPTTSSVQPENILFIKKRINSLEAQLKKRYDMSTTSSFTGDERLIDLLNRQKELEDLLNTTGNSTTSSSKGNTELFNRISNLETRSKGKKLSGQGKMNINSKKKKNNEKNNENNN